MVSVKCFVWNIAAFLSDSSAKLAFDDPKRVIYLGADARLEPLTALFLRGCFLSALSLPRQIGRAHV